MNSSRKVFHQAFMNGKTYIIESFIVMEIIFKLKCICNLILGNGSVCVSYNENVTIMPKVQELGFAFNQMNLTVKAKTGPNGQELASNKG